MNEKTKTFPIVKILSGGSVIPVIRTMENFRFAMNYATAPSIMLLFGDIIGLPQILTQAKQYNKRIILHMDMMGGISKDIVGVKFLARSGVTAIVTTRTQLVRFAREEGMIVIQRLFLMDSESIKVGIQLLRNCKPDIVEIMPAHTPARVMQELIKETGLPTMAGGLLHSEEDVTTALKNGACAVSTSNRDLWQGFLKDLVG